MYCFKIVFYSPASWFSLYIIIEFRISEERSRLGKNQPKEEKVEKAEGDMRKEKGGTNPFECEDCRYKEAGDNNQCSACDAGTQTERVKKSNCRVM